MHVCVCKRDREGEIQRESERWGEQQTQRELEGGRERDRDSLGTVSISSFTNDSSYS